MSFCSFYSQFCVVKSFLSINNIVICFFSYWFKFCQFSLFSCKCNHCIISFFFCNFSIFFCLCKRLGFSCFFSCYGCKHSFSHCKFAFSFGQLSLSSAQFSFCFWRLTFTWFKLCHFCFSVIDSLLSCCNGCFSYCNIFLSSFQRNICSCLFQDCFIVCIYTWLKVCSTGWQYIIYMTTCKVLVKLSVTQSWHCVYNIEFCWNFNKRITVVL